MNDTDSEKQCVELYLKISVAVRKVYMSLEQFQDKSLTWNNEGMKLRRSLTGIKKLLEILFVTAIL